MNALFGLAIAASVIHGILFDGTFWKIYGVLFILYLALVLFTRNMRDNHKRKIIMASTWSGKYENLIFCSEASDPTSYCVDDFNVTNALEYCKQLN